jgi:hypothetical protein
METLVQIWSFERAQRNFDSYHALVDAVCQGQTDDFHGSAQEKMLLAAHLFGPKFTLLPTRNQHPFEYNGIDALARAGGGPPMALLHLQELQLKRNEDRKGAFASFNELVLAVARLNRRAVEHKVETLAYLKAPNCHLFDQTQHKVREFLRGFVLKER